VLLDLREEPVEVRQIRYVTLDSDGAGADLGDRFVEGVLPATGDEDACALGGEPAGGGQADPAGRTGDHRSPVVKLSHAAPPRSVVSPPDRTETSAQLTPGPPDVSGGFPRTANPAGPKR
jgi:hypothetical protein